MKIEVSGVSQYKAVLFAKFKKDLKAGWEDIFVIYVKKKDNPVWDYSKEKLEEVWFEVIEENEKEVKLK